MEEELINNMEILFGVSSIRQKEAEELAKKRFVLQKNIRYFAWVSIVCSTDTRRGISLYKKTIINLSNKPTILYNNPKKELDLIYQ
ncbi:hypothetical protein GCM10020331_005350 [Ectobacillus funiculus]